MERRETESVRDEATGIVRQETHVTSESAAGQAAESADIVRSSVSPGRRAVELIYLFFGVINGLLLIRIVLKMLAANPLSGFASFVYSITDIFLAPFRNLLPAVTSGRAVLEMSAVVAIIVYALIGWGLARLIAITMSRSVTVSHRSQSRRPHTE
jgi:uncharacterized protein YggT (Ycf19 family)